MDMCPVDTIVTPLPCFFVAGQWVLLQTAFNSIDATFRKLFRSAVGPPAATDRRRRWHEILHEWIAPVLQFVEQFSVKHWSLR